MNTGPSAKSIRDQLRNLAKVRGQDFNALLTLYGLERFLYRLGVSEASSHFLLKGGMLFNVWYAIPVRLTRDIDLLRLDPIEELQLKEIIRSVASYNYDDGIVFDLDSIEMSASKENDNYPGTRFKLFARLQTSEIRIQVDIAAGDSVIVTESPTKYSTIFSDMPAPELMTYSIYSVIAEKFETIVKRGIANSRLKDYFDSWFFSSHEILDGHELQCAFNNTFARRGTAIPHGNPMGLTAEFLNGDKTKSWIAFLSTNELTAPPLSEVAAFIQELTLPVTSSLITGKPFIDRWDGRHWEN